MIRKGAELVKNGYETQVVYYSYDDEKPKCWIENFEYKFNKQIIFIETIKKEKPVQEYPNET